MAPSQERLPIAVLISGGGTTLKNLLANIEAGDISVDIRLVVSSSPSAGGLRFAEEAGIETLVVKKTAGAAPDVFSESIFGAIRERQIKLVVMGGFLKHLPIPADFENRVMNIHPGLIPAFCGAGFYGQRVHKAVLEYGAKISGCTVHFVDNEYDHGPIVLQKVVPVHDDDTPETLAARVFEQECLAYPEAIQLFATGRLKADGRRIRCLDG